MSKDWPTSKAERESLEIKGFIQAYGRLPSGRHFEVVDKSEKPDYIVRDISSGEIFGIELTSVYKDDRSVPDEHIPSHEGMVDIPYDQKELDDYLDRLADSVRDKIVKARNGYDISNPLILSVYVNEYISIFIRERDLKEMVNRHPGVFDDISPFLEVVFWPPFGDGSVFHIPPSFYRGV